VACVPVKKKPSETTLKIVKNIAEEKRSEARRYWHTAHRTEGNAKDKSILEELAHMHCRDANALREVLLYLGERDLPPEPLTLDEVKS